MFMNSNFYGLESFSFEKEFLYIIIFKQMIDCNFLASFLSMYCKNLLFKKLINKVIIIIYIVTMITNNNNNNKNYISSGNNKDLY